MSPQRRGIATSPLPPKTIHVVIGATPCRGFGEGDAAMPRLYMRIFARVGLILLPTQKRYKTTLIAPVPIKVTAQMRSRLNQALRSMPTPSFSKTMSAITAVTMR